MVAKAAVAIVVAIVVTSVASLDFRGYHDACACPKE
jgi:hypothetical protein